jgi:Cys-rich repeat protein
MFMGANQMTWITRHVLAIGIAILPVLFPASNSIAQQQQCTGSGDCPFPQMCLPGFFGGFCDLAACNFDSDCRTGSVCKFGLCLAPCRHNSDCPRGEVCRSGVCLQAPPPPAPPGPPPPAQPHYYTEGGVCGTIRLGGALSGPVKHLGCAPGLQCVGIIANGTGTCRRPPS